MARLASDQRETNDMTNKPPAKATQNQIDKCNMLVENYKINGDQQARLDLLAEFDAYIKKQVGRWSNYFKGVHPYEHSYHEARIIFCELLDEFTIGGTAYFTVYIQRKLPLRFRYFFIKEIRRRQRDLNHNDEQLDRLEEMVIDDEDNGIEEMLSLMVQNQKLQEVYDAMKKALSDREIDMVNSHLLNGETQRSIASRYGISRSRVSNTIKLAIEKIQLNVIYRSE
ncbi:sigma-70 family RNA polymerase sigma factor [Bacillus phage vB_BpsS-140]|nr:sigma-70 family RNA polymerase sigma factor [Bacillus phage vB_BpsS-140]